jgi:hypothetical protein
MGNFFSKLIGWFKAAILLVLVVLISGVVGYLVGNRALDRGALEDEIRSEVETDVIDDVEERVRKEFEDDLDQAEALKDETLQTLINALLDDIESRVKGVSVDNSLSDFNEEIEFGE